MSVDPLWPWQPAFGYVAEAKKYRCHFGTNPIFTYPCQSAACFCGGKNPQDAFNAAIVAACAWAQGSGAASCDIEGSYTLVANCGIRPAGGGS